MPFVFSFWDLSLWFATTSVTLLVASELLSPYFGKTKVKIDTKKLRIVAIIFALAFIFAVGIRVLSLMQG